MPDKFLFTVSYSKKLHELQHITKLLLDAIEPFRLEDGSYEIPEGAMPLTNMLLDKVDALYLEVNQLRLKAEHLPNA